MRAITLAVLPAAVFGSLALAPNVRALAASPTNAESPKMIAPSTGTVTPIGTLQAGWTPVKKMDAASKRLEISHQELDLH